jgi:chitodextrinase
VRAAALALLSVACGGPVLVVTQISPAEGAIDVALDAGLIIQFDRVPQTVNAVLSPDAGQLTQAFKFTNPAELVPVNGFAGSTAYTATITAADAQGNGLANPFVVHFTTAPATPPPIIDLAVLPGSLEATRLELTWTSTGGATSYDLGYVDNDTFCKLTDQSFAAATRVPTGALQRVGAIETASVTGLSPSTQYCFAIRSINGTSAFSNLSNIVMVFTGDDVDQVPPGKPVMTATDIFSDEIDLAWISAGDDGFTGFAVDRELRYLSGQPCSTYGPTVFASGTAVRLGSPVQGGTQETVQVTGLTPNLTYCFLQKVADEVGNVTFSDVLSAATIDTTPPGVPQIGVGAIGDDAFAVIVPTVPDNGSGEGPPAAKYTLAYYSPASGTCPLTEAAFVSPVILTSPGQLPAPGSGGFGIDRLVVGGLASSTLYCVALAAEDLAGNDSGFSAVQSVITGGPAAALPDAILDARASVQSDSADGGVISQLVVLEWTAAQDETGGAVASYEVRSATDAACPISAESFASAELSTLTIPPELPGFTEVFVGSFPVASDDTSLCFAVKATDAAGGFKISNSASPPHRIQGAAVSAVTDQSFTVTFDPPLFQANTTRSEVRLWVLAAAGLSGVLSGECPAAGTTVGGLASIPVVIASADNSASVAGLSPGADYCAALQAVDTAGDDSWSDVFVVTTWP